MLKKAQLMLSTFNLIIVHMKPHLRIAGGIIGYPILLGRLLKVVCVDIDPEWCHRGANGARGGSL